MRNRGWKQWSLVAVALVACGEPTSERLVQSEVSLNYSPGQCGVLFTASVTEDDPELAAFGMPAQYTDVTDVCETWTGSDYTVSATEASSTLDEPSTTEDVARVDYANGQLQPIGSAGGLSSPFGVGPTAFDMVTATSEQVQASIDEPYYAVYAYDPCPPPNGCNGQFNVLADSAPSGQAARYTKHGLKRRGVRALLEQAQELSRSPDGQRRFEIAKDGKRWLWLVDPVTELIDREEYSDSAISVVASHRWSKVAGGHKKDRTDVDFTERVGGRTQTTRTTIRITGLHINGASVQ